MSGIELPAVLRFTAIGPLPVSGFPEAPSVEVFEGERVGAGLGAALGFFGSLVIGRVFGGTVAIFAIYAGTFVATFGGAMVGMAIGRQSLRAAIAIDRSGVRIGEALTSWRDVQWIGVCTVTMEGANGVEARRALVVEGPEGPTALLLASDLESDALEAQIAHLRRTGSGTEGDVPAAIRSLRDAE
ncbi:MAG: hypothetical protein H6737_30465 [Alphaproteobacteria bacterium]|nr:hypothetical protein [Alphaproteobacteria bacterium]